MATENKPSVPVSGGKEAHRSHVDAPQTPRMELDESGLWRKIKPRVIEPVGHEVKWNNSKIDPSIPEPIIKAHPCRLYSSKMKK
jgi:hypothetical protein